MEVEIDLMSDEEMSAALRTAPFALSPFIMRMRDEEKGAALRPAPFAPPPFIMLRHGNER